MQLDYQFLQKNIIDNIPQGYIAHSEIHGYGLFAKVDIYKGDILCILDGQIISWDIYQTLVDSLKNKVHKPYEQYFFMEWNALDETTLLVRTLRTKYSYINHDRNPNVQLKKYPLKIIAIRDIQKGTEITLDYRCEPLNPDYLKTHGATYL